MIEPDEESAPNWENAQIAVLHAHVQELRALRDETAQQHTGDLGHNAMVSYDDCRYSTQDGEIFFNEEVLISDKTRHVYLTAGEALSLLDWLTQEKSTLQRLARSYD